MIETHYYDNCDIYQDVGPEAVACAFIFPEDYGAKGDGTTDDADAIQNCIANAETTKKVIYFSGGKVYKCSKTLTINTPIQMTGATTNSATILSEAAIALEIICNLESVATTLNLSIGNLIFKSAAWTENTAPTIDNIAIKFNDSWLMYMQLKNLQFFGYNKCFYFYGTANNRPYAHNILISHVNTWDCNNIIDQLNTSDGNSFVYGGDIEFIQFENIHKPFNTDYVINLNKWQNLNLKNLIIEGRTDAAYKGVIYNTTNTYKCDFFYLEMLGTACTRAIFVQENSQTYSGVEIYHIYGQPTGDTPWADTTTSATLWFSTAVLNTLQVLKNAHSYNDIKYITCGTYWAGSANDDKLPENNIYHTRNNGNIEFVFNSGKPFARYMGTNDTVFTRTGTAELTTISTAPMFAGVGWDVSTGGTITFSINSVTQKGVFAVMYNGDVTMTGGTKIGSKTQIHAENLNTDYYFITGTATTLTATVNSKIYDIRFYPAINSTKGEC